MAGDTSLYGRIAQVRTGHAYSGEFRPRFSFDEPHTCPCDNSTIESREHVLAHCPRFERWRQPLRDVSRGIALSEILGKVDGIAALEAFLRASGAFARPIDTPTRAPLAEPTTAPDEHLDNG
ncbi:hypothetical protein D9611_000176 [Ephemerocybe angulata]|uniref:Uncharacterized protein n=1 Tax=Ephemerocybe angulata TaxID=980116 RepID=A0A8H5BN63_9AGAR|nr:hypothetical protein D9611_000176 [Tulosesus angulatus]